MKVEKRDGKIVDFDLNKIENAITKANENSALSKKDKISKKEIKEIIKDIFDILNDQNIMKNKYTHDKESGDIVIKIEDIQDTVENTLFKRNHFQLCIEYDRYRKERDRIRNKNSDLMNVIREKLSAKNVQNQNANVDERSFGGRKGEADSELLRQIALDDRMSEMAKNNHLTNEIYTHDLDSYELGQHNCLSIPFDDLLSKGFKTRQTDVRPANSINTAFQLIAVCFQIQSLQQFGGCSATHLDWTMVPYVKKSFNKHYRTVSDILWDPIALFRKNDDSSSFKNINIPDTESIDSVKYKGKWFNFIKRYKWLKAYKLTLKELNQAVEGLYHNLNTLQSRSGKSIWKLVLPVNSEMNYFNSAN